jgi:protein O-GlcNAc transferase
MIAAMRDGVLAVAPFPLLTTPATSDDQLKCARLVIKEEFAKAPFPLWQGERYAHDRIRLAYVSADFRDHPVSYLAAGLFEAHDRARFEVFGIGFGPDDPSEMRSRIKRSFDRFIDVDQQNDAAAAKILRDLEIDVAVDLMGMTGDTRLGIFATRPCPVQVSYLGYAGTIGADYIDYVIADRFLIPSELHASFAEKVVWLPDSFQANDRNRAISQRTPSRRECGLPEQGLVFCCFNRIAKITPHIFDVWMRLLKAVDGSVLWLSATNESARRNLSLEAVKRGVSADRLIFAPKLPRQADHLARHRLADLFLDTLYFNAHTTASDALWAGLPVLTCSGHTCASRVAGSLLQAAGMPELVTHSLADYEKLALKLATDPAMLSSTRQKLARQRGLSPLFDTLRFTRHLEAAFQAMCERSWRGEAPESFAVSPWSDARPA